MSDGSRRSLAKGSTTSCTEGKHPNRRNGVQTKTAMGVVRDRDGRGAWGTGAGVHLGLYEVRGDAWPQREDGRG